MQRCDLEKIKEFAILIAMLFFLFQSDLPCAMDKDAPPVRRSTRGMSPDDDKRFDWFVVTDVPGYRLISAAEGAKPCDIDGSPRFKFGGGSNLAEVRATESSWGGRIWRDHEWLFVYGGPVGRSRFPLGSIPHQICEELQKCSEGETKDWRHEFLRSGLTAEKLEVLLGVDNAHLIQALKQRFCSDIPKDEWTDGMNPENLFAKHQRSGSKRRRAEAYEEACEEEEDGAAAPLPAAATWYDLGVQGGATVDGCEYTRKECFIRALEMEPLHYDAWHDLGYEGGGTVNQIEYSKKECYLKALEEGGDRYDVWFNLGDIGGDVTVDGIVYDAKECTEKALKINPDGHEAWNNLGYYDGGRVGGKEYDPKECYVKALEIDGECLEAWYNLGHHDGGMVHGKQYSKKECLFRAAQRAVAQ